MRQPHWYDDSYDPLECHWCGLNYFEALEYGYHLPLEPGRKVLRGIYGLRYGLCTDRAPHEPHEHASRSLGTYMCSGDQDDREPERSRRKLIGEAG